MIATRIIPVLLHRGANLVKGECFDSWRTVGHAAQAANIHQSRGVDELVMLDIAATPEGRGPDISFVKSIASSCFMPLTIGGGITNIRQIKDLFDNGADKVVIGTAATYDRKLVQEAARRYGSQAIVIAVDVKDDRVMADCGRMTTQIDPVAYAQDLANEGAGEILLTSVSREGTLTGYDLDLITKVANSVTIPVVANGGAGNYEHMAQALRAGAHAVAAGALFQFEEATPLGAAKYLRDQGFNMRVAA